MQKVGEEKKKEKVTKRSDNRSTFKKQRVSVAFDDSWIFNDSIDEFILSLLRRDLRVDSG